jgi:RNA polymerase-associated protein CTR9
MERSPSPTTISRPFDIELSGQEVITVDLDNLDSDPSDLLDVLRESQCTSSSVWVWTKLAGEYWRHGKIDAAERIGRAGVESA